MDHGFTKDEAIQRAPGFLYGPEECPPGDYSALRNSVWGKASHDYAASLSSDVTFVGVKAPHGRIGVQVELPAALGEGTATAIGGHSADALQQLRNEGGNVAVVERIQFFSIHTTDDRRESAPQANPIVQRLLVLKPAGNPR